MTVRQSAIQKRPARQFADLPWWAAWLWLVPLLFVVLLAAPVSQAEPLPAAAVSAKQYARLQYLGTAGTILKVGDVAVMTDPYLTNVPISDWLLLRDLQPDVERISRIMAPDTLPDLPLVRALLLGHGHFDHLLDVSAVVPLLPRDAKIYGSTTSVNQIASAVAAARRIDVLQRAVGLDSEGPYEWLSVGESLRMLPLRSGHSYHVGRLAFAGGRVLEPLPALPGDLLDWQCGEPLSYMLEWLRPGKVVFRALFFSSAADYPLGLPPADYLTQNSRFDLVMIPVAKFQSVSDFPDGLLKRIQARHLVLIHWEKFWQPYHPGQEQPLSAEGVQLLQEKLARLAPQAQVHQPRRLDVIQLPLEND